LEKILREGFTQYGLALPPEAAARFSMYFRLLEESNQVMNLTAITGEENVARLHFLDCAALLRYAPFAGARVVDVGTGAGFPGLVLRIAEPSLSLTLLDSQQKKVDFLYKTCHALGFSDVHCVHVRAEESPQYREGYDIAVARAVARLHVLCELCLPMVRVGGLFLAMKGPDCSEEMEEAGSALRLLGGKFLEPQLYTIPGTDIVHSVVPVEKTAPTPAKYPRRFAKIQKQPL
jgi:16S rRNA (guanine527-N7)-methyltransferase